MILFGESHKPGSFIYYLKSIEEKVGTTVGEYKYPQTDLDEIFKNYENSLIFDIKENETTENSLAIYNQSENYSGQDKIELHQDKKRIEVEKKLISHQELASVS
jgi:hypothetical protein